MIVANSETAVVWESLEGLFSRLTWRSGGWNPIFGPKLGSKAPKLPKLISREPFVVESWLTHQNDHETYFTMGVIMTK